MNVWWTGEKNNGKSRIDNLLKNVFGDDFEKESLSDQKEYILYNLSKQINEPEKEDLN